MPKPSTICGSSVVEMLLFLPLFSLLLFAGSDLGLRFAERGQLATALRGAMNIQLHQPLLMRGSLRRDNQGFANFDFSKFRETTADTMFARILSTRQARHDSSLAIGVVLLRFDEQSGALLSYQLLEPLAVRGASQVPELGAQSLDAYLAIIFSKQSVPSGYAIPLVQSESSGFAREGFGVVAQLSSGVPGFRPDFFLRLIGQQQGTNSVLQETQFAILRTDLS